MRAIKIYSQSQVVLLRNINPLLGRYKLPQEIIKSVDSMLETGSLEEHNYIVVVLTPVRDDVRAIEDAINAYPYHVEFINDIERQEIGDAYHNSKKGKDWFLYKVRIKETGDEVFVFYSMFRKHLYKHEQILF